MNKTIIFTGGHHNSTLEIAKSCHQLGHKVIWIGHKFASKGDKSLSAEYQEVTASGFTFLELKTGKFYRRFNLFEALKVVFGFLQSLYYLLKTRPSLIYSSGGYLSVPVVITGWVLRIPSITHEQTVVAGWANKAIAPFVKKILLTHSSSVKNYPKGKSIVVGLPLRQELYDHKNQKDFSPKLVYITCGKQGSHTINQSVFPIIPELVKKYTVVHQTGSNTLTKDIDRARRIKDRLGEFSNRYTYAPYFFARDAATYIRSADVVVSRSGAHIVYELISLSKKAVFVPIPWVSHNEQLLNANLASKYLSCEVLEERKLNPETLLKAINNVSKLPKKISSIKLEKNASTKIIQIIESYL